MAVDARTDIWSVGVVLYEMLTGQRPFSGASSTDILAAILDRDPTPLTRFDSRYARRTDAHRRQGDAQGSGAAVSGHEGPAARSPGVVHRTGSFVGTGPGGAAQYEQRSPVLVWHCRRLR